VNSSGLDLHLILSWTPQYKWTGSSFDIVMDSTTCRIESLFVVGIHGPRGLVRIFLLGNQNKGIEVYQKKKNKGIEYGIQMNIKLQFKDHV
jgi:hypothetical protein